MNLPRDVALIAGSRAVSWLGDEIVLISLLIWASGSGHGPAVVAGLLVAAALPVVVMAPVSGLVVDRVSARRLVAVVSAGQAAVCVGLALSEGPLLVIGLVALLNVGQSLTSPAWQAVIPSVVPAAQVPRALGIVQTATAASMLLGPAVGGLVAGAGGIHLAMLADGATFLLLAGAALLLRAERSPAAAGAPGSTVREAMAGIRLVAVDPLLRALVLLLGLFVLALGAVNVAEVFLVTVTLGASPAVYGLIGAVFAAGMIVGAQLAGRERAEPARVTMLVAALCTMVGAVVALGLAPGLWVAGAAAFVVGVGNAGLNVLGQAVIVAHSPNEVLGRVFATVQAVANIGMLASAAVGGLLLTVLSPRAVIVVCAVLCGVALAAAARPLLGAAAGSPQLPVRAERVDPVTS